MNRKDFFRTLIGGAALATAAKTGKAKPSGSILIPTSKDLPKYPIPERGAMIGVPMPSGLSLYVFKDDKWQKI